MNIKTQNSLSTVMSVLIGGTDVTAEQARSLILRWEEIRCDRYIEAVKAMSMPFKIYDVTGHGFDGSGDTDDRVLWVKSNDPEKLQGMCRQVGAEFCGEVEHATDEDVDFTMPEDFDKLVDKLIGPLGIPGMKYGAAK